MKTILVTGGAGFIGSNFVRHLYKKYPDYKILVLDALTYAGSVQNFPVQGLGSDRFEFWYGDVRNPDIVGSLVSRSNMVFHFAAETHVTRSIYDNTSFFQTDVLGTQVVANSVLRHRDKVELFVHISTSEVYGSAEGAVMDENHPLNPMSPYAAAKCGADRLVYSYWQTYGIPAVIVRPFNNYGPHQHLEKVIPRFITSCILDEPLMVHGQGIAVRDWLHVEDHCDALDALMRTDRDKVIGQAINLGSGESVCIGDIARNVAEMMGQPNQKIQLVGDRPGQVFRHTCDFSKAKELIGFEPKISFASGLKSTAQWYLDNRAWWTPQMWLRSIPIVNADGKRVSH